MKPCLDVRVWRDSDVPGLEVSRILSSPHAFPKHAHEHYAIGVMEDGGAYCLEPDRDDCFVAAGEIALINPGQVHSGIPPSGVRATYRMLNVDVLWMRRLAQDLGREGYPEFTRWVVGAPRARDMLLRLTCLVAAGGELLAKESAMVAAFSLLMAGHAAMRPSLPGPGGEPEAVRRVKEHLHEHLDAKVSLEELAAETGLSRYHLLRVFKAATGMSPYAYHLQLRVEHARRLLLKGLPFVQAASEAGFSDQSHFSNTFRHFFGMTPGQYLAR
ncbi:AraC family transcriptional regulator [Desulfocurvibacter africanus]|uniref:AraC family transcriptional regulator n=1 Tax=Desulfocurvibacter africanus TaxID=873 RepID=UPI00041A9601|nr:AraC family transcriptional regulator [Desulfocurvibacter africanus]